MSHVRYIYFQDTSKRLAKRKAAYAMVEQLEKLDIESLTAKQTTQELDIPCSEITQLKLIEK